MTQTALFTRDGTPTLEAARSARNEGMQQATDHADDVVYRWSETALQYLKRYAETHDRFVGWYVTNEAELSGAVEAPATRKAWGSVFTKAARLGWLQKEGYRQDPNRHANPCPIWKSLIYVETP